MWFGPGTSEICEVKSRTRPLHISPTFVVVLPRGEQAKYFPNAFGLFCDNTKREPETFAGNAGELLSPVECVDSFVLLPKDDTIGAQRLGQHTTPYYFAFDPRALIESRGCELGRMEGDAGFVLGGRGSLLGVPTWRASDERSTFGAG